MPKRKHATARTRKARRTSIEDTSSSDEDDDADNSSDQETKRANTNQSVGSSSEDESSASEEEEEEETIEAMVLRIRQERASQENEKERSNSVDETQKESKSGDANAAISRHARSLRRSQSRDISQPVAVKVDTVALAAVIEDIRQAREAKLSSSDGSSSDEDNEGLAMSDAGQENIKESEHPSTDASQSDNEVSARSQARPGAKPSEEDGVSEEESDLPVTTPADNDPMVDSDKGRVDPTPNKELLDVAQTQTQDNAKEDMEAANGGGDVRKTVDPKASSEKEGRSEDVVGENSPADHGQMQISSGVEASSNKRERNKPGATPEKAIEIHEEDNSVVDLDTSSNQVEESNKPPGIASQINEEHRSSVARGEDEEIVVKSDNDQGQSPKSAPDLTLQRDMDKKDADHESAIGQEKSVRLNTAESYEHLGDTEGSNSAPQQVAFAGEDQVDGIEDNPIVLDDEQSSAGNLETLKSPPEGAVEGKSKNRNSDDEEKRLDAANDEQISVGKTDESNDVKSSEQIHVMSEEEEADRGLHPGTETSAPGAALQRDEGDGIPSSTHVSSAARRTSAEHTQSSGQLGTETSVAGSKEDLVPEKDESFELPCKEIETSLPGVLVRGAPLEDKTSAIVDPSLEARNLEADGIEHAPGVHSGQIEEKMVVMSGKKGDPDVLKTDSGVHSQTLLGNETNIPTVHVVVDNGTGTHDVTGGNDPSLSSFGGPSVEPTDSETRAPSLNNDEIVQHEHFPARDRESGPQCPPVALPGVEQATEVDSDSKGEAPAVLTLVDATTGDTTKVTASQNQETSTFEMKIDEKVDTTNEKLTNLSIEKTHPFDGSSVEANLLPGIAKSEVASSSAGTKEEALQIFPSNADAEVACMFPKISPIESTRSRIKNDCPKVQEFTKQGAIMLDEITDHAVSSMKVEVSSASHFGTKDSGSHDQDTALASSIAPARMDEEHDKTAVATIPTDHGEMVKNGNDDSAQLDLTTPTAVAEEISGLATQVKLDGDRKVLVAATSESHPSVAALPGATKIGPHPSDEPDETDTKGALLKESDNLPEQVPGDKRKLSPTTPCVEDPDEPSKRQRVEQDPGKQPSGSTSPPIVVTRVNLPRLKALIFSTGRRIHGGKRYEAVFSKYWTALSRRLCENLSKEEFGFCQSTIKAFLISKKLRVLHNKLILALLDQCLSPYVLTSDMQGNVPEKVRQRISSVQKEPVVKPILSSKIALDSKPKSCNNELSANHRTRMRPNIGSSRILGSLAIDPFLRKSTASTGMKITENAVWLVSVAVREYAKSLIGDALATAKAMDDGGMVPSPPSVGPNTSSVRNNVPESKLPSKPPDESSKFLLPSDVHAMIEQLPIGCRSLNGCVSRVTYERSLHSSHDHNAPCKKPMKEIQDFLLSKILVSETLGSPTTTTPPPQQSSEPPPAKESAAKTPAEVPDSKPPTPEVKEETAKPTEAPKAEPIPTQPPAETPADRKVLLAKGMGRGAKDLAALKARSSSRTTENPTEPIKEIPVASLNPEPKPAKTEDAESEKANEPGEKPDEKKEDVEVSPQQVASRRGKGSGKKNLAEMMARTRRKDDGEESDDPEVQGTAV